MALPVISSMLWPGFGILILLLLLILLKVLADTDITIIKQRAARRRAIRGGDGSPSTSGGDRGRFELHRAAEEGNLERVRSELADLSEAERLQQLKSRDENEETPLSCAARENRSNVVEYLVSELEKLQGSIFTEDMKDGDAENSDPIHKACIAGHLDVVKILCSHCLRFGLVANLSMFAPNKHGQTILHLAAQNHRVDIVEYLLSLPGAEVQKDAQDKNGQTPRDLAEPHAHLVHILG